MVIALCVEVVVNDDGRIMFWPKPKGGGGTLWPPQEITWSGGTCSVPCIAALRTCFAPVKNACWAWLQYHLMSSTSGLVPHPGNDIQAMHKAMDGSVVRKLTDTEVQQWSDWQNEKGKRSSSKEGAELVEVKEEETESKHIGVH